MRIIVFIPQNDHQGQKIEKAVIVNKTVPITFNFDQSRPPIGIATLSTDENGVIYADLNFDAFIGGVSKIGGIVEISQIGLIRTQSKNEKLNH